MERNTTLQEEIVKLNKIIAVLIEQNDFLKKENAALRDGMEQKVKKSSAAIPGEEINLKNNTSFIPEGGINLKNNASSIPEGGINLKNNASSMSEGGINLKNNASLIPEGGINLKNNTSSMSEGGINLKNNVSSIPQGGSIFNQKPGELPVIRTLASGITGIMITPAIIEVNSNNIGKLRRGLFPYFNSRIKQQYLNGLAEELILLHNNKLATSKEMRKAAGLSVSGFAKHLPMLKRKNLVRKQGKLTYALTPHAVEMMNTVFSKFTRIK